MQCFMNPHRNWLGGIHYRTVSGLLRRYGLRYDDLYDQYYDLYIKEALTRLPREIMDARNQQLEHAMDISMKHQYLPENLQLFDMNKEHSVNAGYGVPTARITRAQAAACRANGGMVPMATANQDKKQANRGKTKRMATDENSQAAPIPAIFRHKRRVVLSDVTNICCENSYMACAKAARLQSKISERAKTGSSNATICSGTKDSGLASALSVASELDHLKYKIVDNSQGMGMLESQGTTASLVVEEVLVPTRRVDSARDRESIYKSATFQANRSREGPVLIGHSSKNDLGVCSECDIVDIDLDNANPLSCSIYASDIYANLRAAELVRRPSCNFMETLQRDITQGMRGILVDWLVEVSEEYKLVPDTLYLTVNIIDRFLSQNYIERQRLQLLGITCMLIASKYEEMCAPLVEEFCFITDNTYTKGEVLKMESHVLKHLAFQLSVPTVKTFLRRFLRAAQASYKVSSLSMGYLANYLAELTLVEYCFLKFKPSIIAASAVFLARWTLDQSEHPWNYTLEHYTFYKASDIKETLIALHELQMNSGSSPLNAIREKYKQQKFESVATLTSPQLLESLFC